MKKALLLLFCLFLITQAKSQEKTDAMLFGDVKSAVSKEHISYALIGVKETTIGTTTDITGHYKLANLPEGKCIIIVKAIGYKTQEKEVFMEKGKGVELFFELEEDILNLEQVVITGTRTEHYVKDVPVRTEVITSKAIEKKNASNLFEALEGTPGIRVENQCQYCNFTMVRMQGLGAEHTQVLINGQPIYSGLAGVYGLQQLSTVDIDRIEVVKGAGSALYGSSAVAGAINIVTKEPSFVPSTTLDIQIGERNTNRYDVSSSIRNEKGNIGLNIYAQKLTGDAIDETGEGITQDEVKNKDGISDRVETNLNTVGFGLFVNNMFFKDDKLILRAKTASEKREGGTMDDDYYKNPLTDGTESITTNRYEASMEYTKGIRNNSELSLNVSYANHQRNATNDSYLSDYMETHSDEVPDLRNMRPYLADENTLSMTFTFGTSLKNHSVLLGLQGYYDQLNESGMYCVVDETSTYYGESYRSDADKSAYEFGFFVQDEWSIQDKLMIVPGLRVDYHNSEEEYATSQQVFSSLNFPKTSFEETSVNPRIAFKYEFSEKFAIRANIGTGFRAPYGFSEDLHLCSGSPRVWKSSDLNPEKSISYNLSADYYGCNTRISMNLFRTDLQDKIGFVDADNDVSAMGYDYQWENIDNAFVQGIEMSVITRLAKDMELGADFTYNQGEYDHARDDWKETEYEEDSKYISRFPTTTGNLSLEYSPDTWNFSITGDYQGTMYIDYYNEDADASVGDLSKIKKTDPFMLFNAKASKKMGLFKIYAGVNNIFNYIQDEKYLDDAAFIYAPLFGTLIYGGLSITLTH